MAILRSLQMSVPRYPVSGPGMGGRSIKVERAEYNTATQGAIAIGDVVQLFKLHPGFRVVGGFVKITGGLGASSTYIIGDAGDDDRYFASASGASAAINTTLAATGLDYLNPRTYTTVNMTWAGANSNTTGSIVVELWGVIEEPA
jgi:hypothetical protein